MDRGTRVRPPTVEKNRLRIASDRSFHPLAGRPQGRPFSPTKRHNPKGHAAKQSREVVLNAYGVRVSANCSMSISPLINLHPRTARPDIPRPCGARSRQNSARRGDFAADRLAGRSREADGATVHPCPPSGRLPKRAAAGPVPEAARGEAVTCTPKRAQRAGPAANRLPRVGRVVTLHD